MTKKQEETLNPVDSIRNSNQNKNEILCLTKPTDKVQ